jgi:hypothetical protein
MSTSCAPVAIEYDGPSTIPIIEQPQWYAIRTRSRCEKMVAEQLELQCIENFLPIDKAHAQMERSHEGS